jgi:hypothetical protein
VIQLSCGTADSLSPAPPISTSSAAAQSSNSHMLWGYWQVAIDTRTGGIQIVPFRAGLFHANVVQFLQSPYPLGVSVKINEMDLSVGYMDLNVSLTHPFTIEKFAGFDVKGIFISHGSAKSQVDSSLKYADIDESRLLNADGWTRWWNQPEFTSEGLFGYTEGRLGTPSQFFQTTLNPFKYFADELGPEDDFVVNPATRGVFRSGEKNSRKYILTFEMSGPQPLIVFNYAVDASWESPTGDPSNLDNFPPEANMPEAFKIAVADDGSNAYYDPISGKNGGNLNLLIDIYDWAGSENPNGAMDELTSVVLESKTLFDDPIMLDETDVVLLDGDMVRLSVYVPDVHPSDVKNQEILIHAFSSEGSYNQGFGTPAPNKPLAAYFLYRAEIYDGVPTPPAPEGMTVEIDRNASGRLTGFTLDWDDSPGAVEYMVYMSDDPYENEGALDMQPTPDSPITESTWSYATTGPDLNGQWLIYVTARGVAGEPASDSEPSSSALVDFSGFENYPQGQNEWRRRFNIIRSRFLAIPILPYGVDGSGALIVSPNSQFIGRSTAYCVSPELPDVSGASNCYFEFAHKRVVSFPDGYGYSVCSTPVIQDPENIDQYLYDPDNILTPNSIVWDYNIDMVDGTDDFIGGDSMNTACISGLGVRFVDPINESGDPYDGWGGTLENWVVSRYSVPKVFSESHSYVGICFGGKEEGAVHIISPPQYPLICDEFALAIY